MRRLRIIYIPIFVLFVTFVVNIFSNGLRFCRTGPIVVYLSGSLIVLGDHISQTMLASMGNRQRPTANPQLGGELRRLTM